MALLRPGDEAPAFALPDQDGRVRSSNEWRGRPLVVFFYPKDETPGCIAEACAFRDHHAEFERAGAAVVGVSRDSPQSHKRFRDRGRFTYPLLADARGEMHKAYGALAFGLLPRRVTYLIDPDGRIAHAHESNVDAAGHADAMLAALGQWKVENGA